MKKLGRIKEFLQLIPILILVAGPIIAQSKKTDLVNDGLNSHAMVTAFDYGYGPSDAPTVTVGTQVWIGKNLNVDHFANGDLIPEANEPAIWKAASENHQPAWCYYGNNPSNGSTYGKLYNWYAVHDPRGLAPKGWHVASDSEWDIMVRQLSGSEAEVNKLQTSGNITYYVTDGVGTLLKSTSGWENNGNGTNSSGIAGLPGGARFNDGTFGSIGKFGYWWTSTEYSANKAWDRLLNNDQGGIARFSRFKSCSYSVRCVKD